MVKIKTSFFDIPKIIAIFRTTKTKYEQNIVRETRNNRHFNDLFSFIVASFIYCYIVK